ncbi:MAG: hypothetical protein WCC04_19055 [Terriglobales bacterium]
MPYFRGPRLKIERAEKHINDLNGEIDRFATHGSYSLSIYNNPKTGDDGVQVEVSKFVPDTFGLLIGDALHNLRGSLDNAMNEVVYRRLRSYDLHTKFPIRITREKLVAAIDGAAIHRTSKAVRDFIVEVVKPYKGGNDALWALHDLNDLDKHRLLLPVMNVNVIHNICVEDKRGEKIVFSPWILSGNSTARYDLIARGGNTKITDNGQPSLLVLFDNGFPFAGMPVIETLHKLTEVVRSTVEGIETVFFGEKWP